MKEFVIVLHDNQEYELKEEQQWYAEDTAKNNKSLNKMITLVKAEKKRLIPFEKKMLSLQSKLDQITKEVGILKPKMEKRIAALQRAKKVINDSDSNWNYTIGALQSQAELIDTAIDEIQQVYPLLKFGVNPNQNLVRVLQNTQQRVALNDKKLSSLLQIAIEESKHVKGPKEMETLLRKLMDQLEKHYRSVDKELRRTRASRQDHLLNLEKHLIPYVKRISAIDAKVNRKTAQIKKLQQRITNVVKRRTALGMGVLKLEKKLSLLQDRAKRSAQAYEVQIANIKSRGQTIEELHQMVKARILDSSPADRALLLSVKNILNPRGPTKLVWNPYYYPFSSSSSSSIKTNSSTKSSLLPYGFQVPRIVDPRDASAKLCANWRFDERSNDFVVLDSSKSGFDGRIHGNPSIMRTPSSSGIKSNSNSNRNGNALEFDGMQNYVDAGTLGQVGSSFNSFSIDLWMRTVDTHPSLSSLIKYIDDGLGGVMGIETNRRVGRPLGGKYPTGQQNSADLDFEPGTVLCYLRDSTGKVLAGHVKAPFYDNKWHHFQWIVVDARVNKMAFYMDGKLYPWIATVEQSPSQFIPLKRNLYIGAGNNRGTPEGFFDGAIDNVRIFCGLDNGLNKTSSVSF